jgi:hypothetical protein
MPSVSSPAEVAAFLVERLEALGASLDGPEPESDRARLRALWKGAPPLLLELWDWCGRGPFGFPLFQLARPLVKPFPSSEPVLDFGAMKLVPPSELVAWFEQAAAHTDWSDDHRPFGLFAWLMDSWPRYIPIAHAGDSGDVERVLCVDANGAVTAWFKESEEALDPTMVVEEFPVVPSFEQWMRDVAHALEHGELRIDAGGRRLLFGADSACDVEDGGCGPWSTATTRR